MKTKVLISLTAVALVAAAALVGCGGSASTNANDHAASAAAAPGKAAVLIQHQAQGCHSWSVNGGPFDTSQTFSLARGGSFVVTNDDIMPHELVQTAGPAVTFVRVSMPMTGDMVGLKGQFGPAMMAHMGAATRVVFPSAGTYRFTTKFGEDYPGMEMTGEDEEDEGGEDNILELTVDVA